jgi:hypothetical protein
MSSLNLVLGDDNLATVRVIRSWDGVLQEADGSDNFTFLNNADLSTVCSFGAEVAGVADHLLGLDGLAIAGDSNEFAIGIGNNSVDFLVEHVCTTVDGAQTGKGLRKLAKTI